jgi:hypothetical protein
VQPIQRTLGRVTGLTLTALIVVAVAAATGSGTGSDPQRASITAAFAGAHLIPAASVPDPCHGPGALIRTHGQVREVSLARGLLAYQHKASGTFVGLCGTTPQGS